jgi:hypothetical protein
MLPEENTWCQEKHDVEFRRGVESLRLGGFGMIGQRPSFVRIAAK